MLVELEAHTTVIVNIILFWDVTQYSFVDIHQVSEEPVISSHTVNKDAAGFF
jgi:hypothetical protein